MELFFIINCTQNSLYIIYLKSPDWSENSKEFEILNMFTYEEGWI